MQELHADMPHTTTPAYTGLAVVFHWLISQRKTSDREGGR
jgi:hypothetical protein